MNPAARRRLLRWFDAHRRDLPWRADRDAYRIWVSEVMLQQTQVATVVGYFEKFLKAFPTVAALAAADEREVLHAWQGLGYYRRARDMHRAAKVLAGAGGEPPDDPAVWANLPGVGRYILGAVLSQAFDRRMPIVEVNTKRVLCRVFGQTGDTQSKEVQAWLWETAEAVLPRRRVGDFNQALMELGALVCTPADPKCDRCPLAKDCVANREGLQNVISVKAVKPPVTLVREVAVVVRKGSRVLLCRRPAAGRWANTWEFPHRELGAGETHDEGANRLLEDSLGLKADVGEEILTVRHGVTRFRITMVCLEASYRSGAFASPFYTEAEWLDPARLGEYPVSSPQRKLAEALTAPGRQRRLF